MRWGTVDWTHHSMNFMMRPILRRFGFWLEFSDISGNLNPQESKLIEINIDASDLHTGEYGAFVHIAHNDLTTPRVILPIRIVVIDSIVTSVVEEKSNQIQDFALIQNYPNPFNPTTTIEYRLPSAGQVILTVYNLRGEEVIRLVDKEMPAGLHTSVWDATTVSSGIYFYRLQAGDFVLTRKMVLLK